MPPKTVYSGTFVHCKTPTELEVLENAAIGVDEQGRIAFIETDPKWESEGNRLNGHADYSCVISAGSGWEGNESETRFFFPGFIDTHIHASQFQNAGVFGKTTLLDWLRKYTFPTEVSFSDASKARNVYTHCVRETLAHGTTCAAYYTTIHPLTTNMMADICQAMGQRAFVGRVCMDSPGNEDYYRDADCAQMIDRTKETIDYMRKIDPEGDMVAPIITPRSAVQCTEQGLKELGSLLASTNAIAQTHVSENRREIDTVNELFPGYGGYVDLYDKCGILGNKTVFAHAIHLTTAEIELIRKRDAKISHCPVSNTCIASGLAPVRDLLNAGIDVGLGTDISGGYSPSILTAAREASGISRLRASLAEGAGATQEESDRIKLSVDECLYLATRGGAKALNVADKVGGFEVGKFWDAQLVDLGLRIDHSRLNGKSGGKGNVALWGGEGWEERVAKWMFCGDDRNTVAVWVAGRLVSGSDQC